MDPKQTGHNSSSKKKTICCPTPAEILMELVLKNDRDGLRSNFLNNRECLNYEYVDHASRPILVIACRQEEVEAETVKTLIDLGADLNYFDKEDGRIVHFAAMRTNKEVLEVVIDEMKKPEVDIDINVLAPGGNNALHCLIRYGKREKKEDLFACAKLLIEKGINFKALDNNANSPIYWAKEKGCKTIEKLLREKLEENVEKNHRDDEMLIQFIKYKKEDEFIAFINSKNNPNDLLNSHNDLETILQLACDKGLTKVVRHLIKEGADPNKTMNNTKKPIEIAADHGFHEIFQIILDHKETEIPVYVPITLLTYFRNKDYVKCFQILLKKLKNEKLKIEKFKNGEPENEELKKAKIKLEIFKNLNFLENSPLLYAIRYADSKTVLDLLSLGASLGTTNIHGFMPIREMKAELLEKHLDSCVEYWEEGESITFNYKTIIPPQKAEETSRLGEDGILESSESSSRRKNLECETQVISYMSQSPELKHLLKHPVIVSFLFMKWHRLKSVFWTNLTFYITFYLTLLGYVFLDYIQFDKERISVFYKCLADLSFLPLAITFIMLVFRELFQMIVSPKKYWYNLENYIELSLMAVTFAMLFIRFPSPESRKQLSALAILSAAFVLILMIGQHPNCSTNVVMLRKICLNFFWFFLWYFLLIVAFALSFYIIFSKTPPNILGDVTNPCNKTDKTFTADPENSMFKTILMMAGEIGISDIDFQTIPIISKLIFILSIFMISIILLNLLNGLAVSDIQTIRNDAELFGLICRAQNLMYIESMVVGNIIPKTLLKKIKDKFCCYPSRGDAHCVEMQPLAEAFRRPTDIEITVDRKGEIKDGFCSGLYLDGDTMEKTLKIVQARENNEKNEEISELKEKIEKLETLIINWRTEVQTICQTTSPNNS